MMFDHNHILDISKRIILFAFFITFSFLTACGGSSSSDNIDEMLVDGETLETIAVLLTGRAVKGVIKNGNITAYKIDKGKINKNDKILTANTNQDGSFNLEVSNSKLTEFLYLEATTSGDSSSPTYMTCDSINGCGLINGSPVDFGQNFILKDSFILRNIIKYSPNSNQLTINFTPLGHMAVAYAESLPGGLNKNNIETAINYISSLFLLSQAFTEYNPVDLTSTTEIDNATDEELVVAILSSAFLNIGTYPNYIGVESVLLKITELNGMLISGDTSDPNALSMVNLINIAINNTPSSLQDRTAIANHLNKIYQSTQNNINNIELSTVVEANGKLASSSHHFECQDSCQYNLTKNELVSINAVADNGFEFSSWNNTCPGLQDQSHPVCEFSLTEALTVTASFNEVPRANYNLFVSVNGSGSVVLNNQNLTCDSNCVFSLEASSLANLSANAGLDSSLKAWTLDQQSVCGTNTNCEITMNGDHTLDITFSQNTQPTIEYVTLTVINNGSGIISDSSLNLTCQNSSCSYQLEKGTMVNFTATPLDSNSHEFSGWQGLCSGSGDCIHTLNADGTLTAVYTSRPPMTLTINIIGNGSVSDNSLNVSCNTTSCNTDIDFGSVVNLIPSAKTGYKFDRWETDCQGSSSCSLTMDSNHSVTAVFVQTTGSATINWAPPTEREDSTALSEAEIKKYIIYYGTSSRIYEGAIEVGITSDTNTLPTELIISGLLTGTTYYFAGVAIDSDNLTSALSNEISKVVPY